MQQRQILLSDARIKYKEKEKENEDNYIYDTYLAYKGLMISIQNGSNLKTFFGKSHTQIVNELGRDFMKEKVTLSASQFLAEYKKSSSIANEIKLFVSHPENLVHYIRKTELPKLRLINDRKMKTRIFSMYADYLLDRKFPQVKPAKYEEAKDEHFSTIAFKNIADNLEDRLFALYKARMLSENLCSDIYKDKEFQSYYFPTETDLKDAEKYDISFEPKKPISKDISDNDTKDKPIFVFPPLKPGISIDQKFHDHLKYIAFSPYSFVKPKMLINGKTYFTVFHYIIVSLMVHNGIKYDEAYDSILKTSERPLTPNSFANPVDANNIYQTKKEIAYETKLTKHAIEGLQKKFQSRLFQDFLLSTGDATLMYNDREDNILGVGKDERGKNIVGYYLMQLRNDFLIKRHKEDFNLLTTSDITWIFEKNLFMKDWIKKRVIDSCRVSIIIKNYVKDKFNVDAKLSKQFMTAVLDNIYQPCSEVYAAAYEIKAAVPEYFKEIVRKCNQMESVADETIEVIWKRLAVIIYYLIQHLVASEKKIENISSEIGKVQIITNNH